MSANAVYLDEERLAATLTIADLLPEADTEQAPPERRSAAIDAESILPGVPLS